MIVSSEDTSESFVVLFETVRKLRFGFGGFGLDIGAWFPVSFLLLRTMYITRMIVMQMRARPPRTPAMIAARFKRDPEVDESAGVVLVVAGASVVLVAEGSDVEEAGWIDAVGDSEVAAEEAASSLDGSLAAEEDEDLTALEETLERPVAGIVMSGSEVGLMATRLTSGVCQQNMLNISMSMPEVMI